MITTKYKWESSSKMIKSATEELVKASLKDGWSVSVFYGETYILNNNTSFDIIMGYIHQCCFDGDPVTICISKGNKKDFCSVLLNQGSPDKEICHSYNDKYISDWCFRSNNGQKEI